MVEEPSRIFEMFEPDDESLIYIHQKVVETCRDLINLKRRGFKVGVALSPATI